MSGPDGIDERFGTLVGELRSGEVTASPELRERVRAVATRGPEPPGARFRQRLPRRRLTLVLVPVCALVAAAVGFGVLGSGGSRPRTDAAKRALKQQARNAGGAATFAPYHAPPPSVAMTPSSHFSADTAVPAPSGSRAQIYSANLRLRVSDLSGTTKEAIRLTRGWGGYVVSVDYGSARKSGDAYLVVRVPVVKVQTAIARLTALGTILDDHVSITDIQGQLNRRFSQMADLRAQIANLRAKLTDSSLTTSQRAFFEAAVAKRQAALARLHDAQSAQRAGASFATVALELQTKKAASAVPAKPSRIGQALHDIGRVLVTELEILLYVLLIGAPFVVLALLVWASRRSLRRRSDDELLAR